jgi:predicted N-acyltransferase
MWISFTFAGAALLPERVVSISGRAQARIRRTAVPTLDGDFPSCSTGRPLRTRESQRRGLTLSVLNNINEVPRTQWNALAEPTGNPFIMWDFLHALEASCSVGPAEGWMPQHLIAHSGDGRLVGAVPMYLKSHSHGEYVFDQAWSRSYRSSAGPSSAAAGGYYPKLQACVPFTPVAGPRVIVASNDEVERSERQRVLTNGLVALADRLGVSSVHVTFAGHEDASPLKRAGFLPRVGLQYHWTNAGFSSFDDFLGDLKQSRRKSIRQERRKVQEAGLRVRRLRGSDITARHWDAFFACYTRTSAQKFGGTYLARSFFDLLSDSEMCERLLLVVAEDRSTGELVAGALNILGDDCVYGRLWGSSRSLDSLHFELCYYQAIEAAIELGLPRVEAGAQGEHKIARGYIPTLTFSHHYLREAAFSRQISRWLEGDRQNTYISLVQLATQRNPFKRNPAGHLREQGVRVEGQRIILVDRAASSEL